VLFCVVGFGPARLLLPERLRRHELIWVPPIGAAALALELTVLGYAYVRSTSRSRSCSPSAPGSACTAGGATRACRRARR